MKRIMSLFAGMLMSICLMCPLVAAQTTAFTYQGSLNTGGSPANGNHDFEFTLFDALSGGSQSQTITVVNVVVTDGLFNVRLDFGDSVFPGANRFLEIRVRQSGGGSYTTLAPRQSVTSAPYSIRSLNATNALQLGGISATGFIRNTTTPQPSSNFNISGDGIVGGNFGIGTTAPARRLHVSNGSSGAVSLSTSDFVVEDDASAFQHFLTPDDAESGILFGDPAASIGGGFIFNNAATNNGIQFRAGGNTTRMTLDGSGNLGIGTGSPTAKLEVSNGPVLSSGTGGRFTALNPANQAASVSLDWLNNIPRIRFGGTGEGSQNGFVIQGTGDVTKLQIAQNGTILAAGSVIAASGLFAFDLNRPEVGGPLNDVCAEQSGNDNPRPFKLVLCSQSSLRYKEDVREFNPGLSVVSRLRPVTFRWKERSGTELGLVAEEVAKIEPQMTFSNASGEVEGVKYDRIGVVLINAIKEQQTQIEAQQKEIESLKATVQTLQAALCEANPQLSVCKGELQ